MENITTEGVIDKSDMFQARFRKVDEFSWWDMDRIKTDAGMQFTSKYLQEVLSVHGVRLAFAAPEHHESNVQFEVTWQTFQTIAHSIVVHAWVFW